MATSGAQIAAFLSRASRHRALVRRVRSAGVFALDGGAVSDRARALAWRRTAPASPQWMSFSTAPSSGGKQKLPSLAISEAFGDDESDQEERDDHSDDDDDDLSFGYEMDEEEEDEEYEPLENAAAYDEGDEDTAVDLSADEQRELAKQLRVAMERKKQWMQRLAEAGEFDALLKVVYECYQPLYESHPKLQHVTCRLFESYEDPVAAAEAVTKYHPRWYDDRVTKATENEALALLVQKERPALAMAVFHHREWLASELGTILVPQGDSGVFTDDVEVDFSKHFRSYYSWAAGASAALRDFTQVFTIYENALEQGVFPTANMTFTYLNALIAKREYSAVEALFDQMQKDDRPTNLYFYRQMLFFARVTKNPAMMDVVVNEMKFKGFKLRVPDYLNAIRALDSQFFDRKSTSRGRKKDGKRFFFLEEKYGECLARIADQENAPETYAEQASACEKVLKLFDDMIEEQLEPQRDLFFPRVIAAALFLHDYERVSEYVALYEKYFGMPLTSVKVVTMAVNALLMEDKPVDAWTLVLRAHAYKQKGRARRDNSVLACLGNVCAYIVAKQDTALTVQLLEALDAHRMLKYALTPPMASKLLRLLARDTATVSNEELWDMINERYWLVFPVRSRIKMLDDFMPACMASDRWWIISKVLHERSRSDIPHIPAKLALFISEKGLESPGDLERMELVTHLAIMTDIYAMPADFRVPFCCNVVRALHALRNDSSRGLHRKRQIDKIHMEFLRGKKTSLPADVRAILLDKA